MKKREISLLLSAALALVLCSCAPAGEGLSPSLPLTTPPPEASVPVLETLERLEVTSARVTVVDKGALDCTLKARVEAAALRGAGRQGDAVPWGGAVR